MRICYDVIDISNCHLNIMRNYYNSEEWDENDDFCKGFAAGMQMIAFGTLDCPTYVDKNDSLSLYDHTKD